MGDSWSFGPASVLVCLLLVMGVVAQTFEERLERPKGTLRFVEFNAAMNRRSPRGLRKELRDERSENLKKIAATIQLMDPDVLVIMEFDYDRTQESYKNFYENYLSMPQKEYESKRSAEDLKHYYGVRSNTGLLSSVDLDGDGNITIPGDTLGFGFFRGQYASAVYSKFPILYDEIRTFMKFKWNDMPNNLIPTDYYSPEAVEVLRLSSKNHADIPIQIRNKVVHFLVSHPTPPVFDGPEDRNGRRNADEIRFWTDYITPGKDQYIYDDAGNRGGFSGDYFVILGDLNADPVDGDGISPAILNLLNRCNVIDALPSSQGGAENPNDPPEHMGDPKLDTAIFNLRVDYVLPSSCFTVAKANVFWPGKDEPYADLVDGNDPTDHRAIFVDVIPKRSYRTEL